MGKPAARVGDMHTCPVPAPVPHVGGPLLPPGVITVLIGGMPAATVGNMCVCAGPPDMVIRGSTGVFIGGRPAARMGDNTVHGGIIVSGFPTVLIGEVGGSGSAVGGDTSAAADSSGGGWLDGLQLALDIVGLVPGLGEIADGANALIYLGRGDYTNAALSAAAMIPIGGQAATAAKLGIKGADAAKTVVKNTDEVANVGKIVAKKADEIFDFTKHKMKKGQKLGDFGEDVVEDMLRKDGYTRFYRVQNRSGNGVDIVGRKPNGDMMVAEVKATKQSKKWNNGDTKDLPLSKDQKQGGQVYSNDRLGRAANSRNGYTDGTSSKEGRKAIKSIYKAKDNGAEVLYKKYDVYVNSSGSLRGNPVQRNW